MNVFVELVAGRAARLARLAATDVDDGRAWSVKVMGMGGKGGSFKSEDRDTADRHRSETFAHLVLHVSSCSSRVHPLAPLSYEGNLPVHVDRRWVNGTRIYGDGRPNNSALLGGPMRLASNSQVVDRVSDRHVAEGQHSWRSARPYAHSADQTLRRPGPDAVVAHRARGGVGWHKQLYAPQVART